MANCIDGIDQTAKTVVVESSGFRRARDLGRLATEDWARWVDATPINRTRVFAVQRSTQNRWRHCNDGASLIRFADRFGFAEAPADFCRSIGRARSLPSR